MKGGIDERSELGLRTENGKIVKATHSFYTAIQSITSFNESVARFLIRTAHTYDDRSFGSPLATVGERDRDSKPAFNPTDWDADIAKSPWGKHQDTKWGLRAHLGSCSRWR
jgi:hypothetical protein